MSKVKLYDLKTDKVVMEVEPVDAREILASKDCGVSNKSKAERAAEKEEKEAEGPKKGSKDWIIAELEKTGKDFDASSNKAELQAILDSVEE